MQKMEIIRFPSFPSAKKKYVKKKIETKKLKQLQPTLPDGDVYMKEMSW